MPVGNVAGRFQCPEEISSVKDSGSILRRYAPLDEVCRVVESERRILVFYIVLSQELVHFPELKSRYCQSSQFDSGFDATHLVGVHEVHGGPAEVAVEVVGLLSDRLHGFVGFERSLTKLVLRCTQL